MLCLSQKSWMAISQEQKELPEFRCVLSDSILKTFLSAITRNPDHIAWLASVPNCVVVFWASNVDFTTSQPRLLWEAFLECFRVSSSSCISNLFWEYLWNVFFIFYQGMLSKWFVIHPVKFIWSPGRVYSFMGRYNLFSPIFLSIFNFLYDAGWCWLTLIDADWWWLTWLRLIDADRCWLMLIDADWCWNKVQPGFLLSERTSAASPVIFGHFLFWPPNPNKWRNTKIFSTKTFWLPNTINL